MGDAVALKPFLKFPGGKRDHVPLIVDRLPSKFRNYVEPFLGGGAVFFGMQSQGLLHDKTVILGDVDSDLVALYEAVRDAPAELLMLAEKEALFIGEHETDRSRKGAYNELRELWNLGCRDPHYTFYLRAACYNAVFRVNQKGHMNMPPRDTLHNLALPSLEHLQACSWALRDVELLDWHFSQYESDGSVFIGPGTVVYLDPPYDGAGAFRNYVATSFYQDDQIEVLQLAAEWSDRGATVIYSNADTPFIRDALAHYWPTAQIDFIDAVRFVSCKPDTRGVVTEILARSCA